MEHIEVAIIGDGVVGLAAAGAIAARGRSACVIERHPRVGLDASTHNTGVIHAGIYYPQGSLKARLCAVKAAPGKAVGEQANDQEGGAAARWIRDLHRPKSAPLNILFSYYSITFWYPTLLREVGRDPLVYLVAFNLGAVVGTAGWGRISETAWGRRGAVSASAIIGVASLPVYLASETSVSLLIGALMMGATGGGIWGMAPSYLTERFPTAVRGVGPGLSYHIGAALGSATPLLLGQLQDNGLTLTGAMTLCIAVSGLLVAAMIWMGPETRGREFTAADEEHHA